MLNRSLRSICENRLYATICFDPEPWRTARLFQTLQTRPDLALRVRHLEINASFWDGLSKQTPAAMRSDGTNGLWMVHNVRSLTLTGLRDWIHVSQGTGFREAVSLMDLTHLGIEGVYHDAIPRVEIQEWDRYFFKDVLAILPAQPSLKSLTLARCAISPPALENFESRLSREDVPALKILTARSDVAAAFLNRISGLESITLTIEEPTDFVPGPIWMGTAANRASVRELTLRLCQHENWARERVSAYMALFPNLDTLRIVLAPYYHCALTLPEGVKACLDTLTSTIHVLPSIRCLEIEYEINREIPVGAILVPREGYISAYWEDEQIFAKLDEFIKEIKSVCPTLETVVDPKRRLWDLSDSASSDGRFPAKLVGKVEPEREPFFIDYPHLERKSRRTLRDFLGWS
ncbi:hypothetical protein FRC01_002156 [Tulasnella sp. 417]|nr:hypothetical protein FRC01_002156 [Tulasnella sp. 417]